MATHDDHHFDATPDDIETDGVGADEAEKVTGTHFVAVHCVWRCNARHCHESRTERYVYTLENLVDSVDEMEMADISVESAALDAHVVDWDEGPVVAVGTEDDPVGYCQPALTVVTPPEAACVGDERDENHWTRL